MAVLSVALLVDLMAVLLVVMSAGLWAALLVDLMVATSVVQLAQPSVAW